MKDVTTEDLRRMSFQEGLILQGCGGDPQEWLDAINGDLAESGIFKNGSRFTEVLRFHHGEATCLLFPFEGVELDLGKLAIWRLQTHGVFGGTWLSEYVFNRLGGFLPQEEGPMAGKEKPEAPIIGADGNIFNLIGIAKKALERAGYREEAQKMQERVFKSGSYESALAILQEYVEPVEAQQEGGMRFGM